jgi:hypothetical protein
VRREITSILNMTPLGGDIRYAVRGLTRHPGFTALAVTALGLGIGAATAIFSIIYSVILNPFPYKDAGRIVVAEIHDLSRSEPGGRAAFRPAEFLEYLHENHVYEDAVGSSSTDVLYRTREGTERLQGAEVTGNAFAFLGVPALLGRGLIAEDARPGAPPVFAMAYKTWVKHFDRDPHVLGRSFVLNGTSRTLVGIMPTRFTYFGADVWIAADPDPAAPEPDGRQRFLLMQAA